MLSRKRLPQPNRAGSHNLHYFFFFFFLEFSHETHRCSVQARTPASCDILAIEFGGPGSERPGQFSSTSCSSSSALDPSTTTTHPQGHLLMLHQGEEYKSSFARKWVVGWGQSPPTQAAGRSTTLPPPSPRRELVAVRKWSRPEPEVKASELAGGGGGGPASRNAPHPIPQPGCSRGRKERGGKEGTIPGGGQVEARLRTKKAGETKTQKKKGRHRESENTTEGKKCQHSMQMKPMVGRGRGGVRK